MTDHLLPARAGRLARRYLPFVAALLAVALTVPSLRSGLWFDDLQHRAALTPDPVRARGFEVRPSAMELFDFFDGDRARMNRTIEAGYVPWWANPDVRIRFFRPLSALTHKADYVLWPHSPWMMHAHSLAWLALLVISTSFFYQRFLAPVVANLAVVIFAVAGSHALAASWLAQRNHLIATTLAVLAVIVHDKSRRENSRLMSIASALLVALALTAGEMGVMAAILIASAVCFHDSGTVRSRMQSLVLPLGVAVVCLVGPAWTGFGVAHTDVYIDPAAHPFAFVRAVATRGPLILGEQWLRLSGWTNLSAPRFGPGLVALVAAAVLGVIVAWPTLRRVAGFRMMLAATILAAVPVCAGIPQTRNLVGVGVPATALLAQFLVSAVDEIRSRRGVVAVVWGVVGGILLVIHLVLSPIALWHVSSNPQPSIVHLQLPAEDLSGSTVIVMNGPLNFAVDHFGLERDADGLSVPRATRAIFPSGAHVEVERTDDRTLRVRAAGGWMQLPFDRVVRSLSDPIPLGYRVNFEEMRLEVSGLTADGRPNELICIFTRPLEDASLIWIAWKAGAYAHWAPPSIGASQTLSTQ